MISICDTLEVGVEHLNLYVTTSHSTIMLQHTATKLVIQKRTIPIFRRREVSHTYFDRLALMIYH